MGGLTSAIADCLDCGWRNESFSARNLAAKHHRKTGHRVIVEQCYSKIYSQNTVKLPKK